MRFHLFCFFLLCLFSFQVLDMDAIGALTWSKYVGGNGDEEGRAVAFDKEKNVYITGWTSSSQDFATQGAYQSIFGGFYDAFLAKYSPEGTLIWCTYFGGSENENSYGIAIDGSDNIYICGSTPSQDGISSTNAYQKNLNGFTDAFLAKFSPDGKRLWSTYFGGPEDEEALGITIDAHSHIYITGYTSSQSGIATPGSYQPVYSGERNKAFLAKFDSSGSIIWATYFGGPKNDYTFAVATDINENVIIVGTASSTTGIATKGAFRSVVGAYYDGFVAKFSASGNLTWATYFGNNGDDECTAVCTDDSGNIYITGNTSSDSGIATAGAFQSQYHGGGHGYDVFLAKISGSGALLWATYYGGTGDDFAWGMDIDKNRNVSIAGYTYSTDYITTTDAYQKNQKGEGDAYIATFDPYGKLKYGTYLGGDSMDYGYGIKADEAGNIMLAGTTSSKTGISQNGNLSGSSDAFLAIFSDLSSGVEPSPSSQYSIMVSPNPFSGKIDIRFSLNMPGRVVIDLCSATGMHIADLSNEIHLSGYNLFEYDCTPLKLAPGCYYLLVRTGNTVLCNKLIKI